MGQYTVDSQKNHKCENRFAVYDKNLIKQIKCIMADNISIYGVHPLYLGLWHSKDKWQLADYPVDKELCELEGGKNTSTKRKSRKGGKKHISKNNEQAGC